MTIKKIGIAILFSVLIIPLITLGQSIDVKLGQSIDVKNIKPIRLKMYPVEGLIWKGESALNTNWNKITETPDGKVWYCGGDHWGSDAITGPWDKSESYERPWGWGNTAISYYDPKLDKSFAGL